MSLMSLIKKSVLHTDDPLTQELSVGPRPVERETTVRQTRRRPSRAERRLLAVAALE